MTEILNHPALGAVLFCALAQWPLAVILRRVGARPVLSCLIWLNLLFPFIGITLIVAAVCHGKYPGLPAPKKKLEKKVLLADGGAP